MEKKQIMEKILAGEKTLTGFFMYPTGSRGEAIAETDNHNGGEYDHTLKSLVSLVAHLGASVAGTRMDNKVAVRVEVNGLDFPVYFCVKDGRYTIAKEVKQKDNREPIEIRWRIDY